MGLIIGLVVLAGDVPDVVGARKLLCALAPTLGRLGKIWADGIYTGSLIAWVKEHIGAELCIVKRQDKAQGFVVLPKRWVVERTFAWLGKYRRLAKDYEYATDSSETWIRIALIHIMVRRQAIKPSEPNITHHY